MTPARVEIFPADERIRRWRGRLAGHLQKLIASACGKSLSLPTRRRQNAVAGGRRVLWRLAERPAESGDAWRAAGARQNAVASGRIALWPLAGRAAESGDAAPHSSARPKTFFSLPVRLSAPAIEPIGALPERAVCGTCTTAPHPPASALPVDARRVRGRLGTTPAPCRRVRPTLGAPKTARKGSRQARTDEDGARAPRRIRAACSTALLDEAHDRPCVCVCVRARACVWPPRCETASRGGGPRRGACYYCCGGRPRAALGRTKQRNAQRRTA